MPSVEIEGTSDSTPQSYGAMEAEEGEIPVDVYAGGRRRMQSHKR